MNLPKIDSDGFHTGFLSEEAVNQYNQASVVQTQLPETAIGQFERWRWIENEWVAWPDYRGHSWYNPLATDQVHKAQSFDDAPPEGWVYWAPGENKVVLPAEIEAAKWKEIRAFRDQLLSQSDWVVTKALETGNSVDPAWMAYRQALRDITLQTSPDLIVWPLIPDSSNATVFEVGAMP